VIDQRRLIQSRGVRSARDRIVFVSRSIWISNFNRDRSRRARPFARLRALFSRAFVRGPRTAPLARFSPSLARSSRTCSSSSSKSAARVARDARRSTDDGS
jgi:hypothetical protein